MFERVAFLKMDVQGLDSRNTIRDDRLQNFFEMIEARGLLFCSKKAAMRILSTQLNRIVLKNTKS